MKAYCVKCKDKREIKDPRKEVLDGPRGKRTFVMGTCIECGTKVSRVIGGVD